MPRRTPNSVTNFLKQAGMLFGFVALTVLFWCVVFAGLAALIFLGLTLFTNMPFGPKLGWSILTAYITFKLGSAMGEVAEFFLSWKSHVHERNNASDDSRNSESRELPNLKGKGSQQTNSKFK